MDKPSFAFLASAILAVGLFASVSMAAGDRCESIFKTPEVAAPSKPATKTAKATHAKPEAISALSPNDVKILSNATKTIYSSFDVFGFKLFVKKVAPELVQEMNWNRPFEQIVGEFYMRLSRLPNFEEAVDSLATNYRLQFTGRDETSKAAIDALANLRTRAITIKEPGSTGISIETQTSADAAISNQVVAALTHSFAQDASYHLPKLIGMERPQSAKINWNRSAHDNAVDFVNFLLRSPNFTELANKMIDSYKQERPRKYESEAQLFAQFAAIRPKSGTIPVKATAEIASQSAEAKAIIETAVQVLDRSFNVDGLKSLISFKVYDSNGQGIQSLVNWTGSRETVINDVIRVMINHPSYSELVTTLAEAYRSERSGRNESDKLAIERLKQIQPRFTHATKATSPKRIVILSKSDWAAVHEIADVLATWSAEGLGSKRGNLLQQMIDSTVPSLSGKIDFSTATRKMANEIIEHLLLSETYSQNAKDIATFLRTNYPGNSNLNKAADMLEALNPTHQETLK